MVKLRAREKRRLALNQWEKVSGYAGRQLVARGRKAVLTAYEIPCRSPELNGRTIMFFSDLHWRNDQLIADDLKDFAAKYPPDWLVFGGDLVNYACDIDSATHFLKTLHAGYDALAAVGNWDRRRWIWFTSERWKQLIAGAGFKVLLNEEFRSHGIRFWGTDDYKLGHPDYRPGNGPRCHVDSDFT